MNSCLELGAEKQSRSRRRLKRGLYRLLTPPVPRGSMELTASDADLGLDNNGDLAALEVALLALIGGRALATKRSQYAARLTGRCRGEKSPQKFSKIGLLAWRMVRRGNTPENPCTDFARICRALARNKGEYQ